MNMPDRWSEVLTSGKTVGGGRYILNQPVGEHTHIWLAHDDIENKSAVLTFLSPELLQDPRTLEELRNQVNALLHLSHPNAAGVYEIYEAEGDDPFIASEYVEGMNMGALQQMQPNRVFSWTFLLPRLKEIFAALQFVHEHNLVQGSLKPSSLMLDRKGQVKLLEVGTASILNNPLFAGPAQAGMGGLLPYLSPQQIDGNPPSPTDDVYSLGVTIYEFLTGTVPFYQGDILPQIRNTQPETIEQRLAKLKISNPVPPIVTSMVMACLAKDPAARPQDIQTLANSLEVAEMTPAAPAPASRVEARPMPVQRTETRGAVEVLPPERSLAEVRPVQPARKPTVAIILGVILALIVGGAAVWYFGRPAKVVPESEPGQVPLSAEDKKRLETEAAALKQELEARKNSGQPVVEPQTAAPAEEETAEEKKARRLALEAKELKTLSDRSGGAFKNLFNGTSLDGWKGDPNYWSVRDGVITAQTPNDAPAFLNTCLIWQKGSVGDFELRFLFKFKILKGDRQALGGVIYRGRPLKEFDLHGYECRLSVGGDNMGLLTSRERVGMVSVTQKTIIKADSNGNDKVQGVPNGELISLTDLGKLVNKEDWNECVITVQGNHFVHQINGRVVADMVDENERKFQASGALALMLNTGQHKVAFVQFKDIKLKQLSK